MIQYLSFFAILSRRRDPVLRVIGMFLSAPFGAGHQGSGDPGGDMWKSYLILRSSSQYQHTHTGEHSVKKGTVKIMNKNFKLVVAALALCGSVSAVHVQAASNGRVIEPYWNRRTLAKADMSQTIGPIGPEADPYLEHYNSVVGNRTSVEATSQIIGPIGPEADPYLEHYNGVVGNNANAAATSQSVASIDPAADPYVLHYYGVAGGGHNVEVAAQTTGSLDPMADPYTMHYYEVAGGGHNVEVAAQTTGSLDPMADPYVMHYYGVAGGFTSEARS
jgi:hypothetical protein